jgi:hypothetical protein
VIGGARSIQNMEWRYVGVSGFCMDNRNASKEGCSGGAMAVLCE